MGCTNEEQKVSVLEYTAEIDRESEVITQSLWSDPFSWSVVDLWIRLLKR